MHSHLALDILRRWSFVNHFRSLAMKLMEMATALSRQLPSHNGLTPPAEDSTLASGDIALCKAAVWATRTLRIREENLNFLCHVPKLLAIRVLRRYRTIT